MALPEQDKSDHTKPKYKELKLLTVLNYGKLS